MLRDYRPGHARTRAAQSVKCCKRSHPIYTSFERKAHMRGFWRVVATMASLLVLPSVVFAQASIGGSVKGASGAVLPGVTVEAASPALIEKTRSVVTDGEGQYKIVDLRPGTYTVSFTLA